jgi:hypothetical protein
MAEVNATVSARPDLSMAENKAHNFEFNFNVNDYLLSRKPEYFVYLFNISETTYTVARPPIAQKITIPGRTTNTEYALAGRFPQPMWVPEGSVDQSALRIDAQDARRFAMDICNPDNLGLNQDAHINPRDVLSQGANLGQKGVFWSLNEVPTKEELAAAKRRMENYYTAILTKAEAHAVSSPGTLSDYLTPEHHAAADYFGQEYPWHTKRSRPMDCPNCGTRIKEGVAYHIVDGDLCVLDWARTVKAGKRTRQQAFESTGDPQFAPQGAPTAKPAAKSNIPTE